jgi:hypothetical protein
VTSETKSRFQGIPAGYLFVDVVRVHPIFDIVPVQSMHGTQPEELTPTNGFRFLQLE